MSDIIVKNDSRLIKVMASQVRRENVDVKDIEEANAIIMELANDFGPDARHQIAQIIAYTITELQKPVLNFLDYVADIKNVAYGDKAEFDVKTGNVQAYIQAKGSTTARSMISGRKVTVTTDEISVRPAINIADLRAGRVNMADLIRMSNEEMTNAKLKKIAQVLRSAVARLGSPYYASGLTKANLDGVINHFRRLGPVTVLGDQALTATVSGFAGMAMNGSTTQFSPNQIDEVNATGFLGRYLGTNLITFQNGYDNDGVTPILPIDMLYVIPGGMTGDARNLKVVNEGPVYAFESQNIDDLTYEIRLDQAFGAAFIVGKHPTIGGVHQ